MAKTTTLTSREFHQDSARVKRAAKRGPVVITERGKPQFLITRFDDRPHRKRPTLAEIPGVDLGFDFEIPEGGGITAFDPYLDLV